MNPAKSVKFVQSRSKLCAKENCPPALLNYVPDTHERVSFSELKAGLNYRNKYVVGKIIYLSDLKAQQKKCNFRKCLIADTLANADEVDRISVFLFNEFASRSTLAEVEGYIAISNFEVESLTLGTCSINGITVLPVQILVKDDTGARGTGIWIAKKMTQSQRPKDRNQQELPKPVPPLQTGVKIKKTAPKQVASQEINDTNRKTIPKQVASQKTGGQSQSNKTIPKQVASQKTDGQSQSNNTVSRQVASAQTDKNRKTASKEKRKAGTQSCGSPPSTPKKQKNNAVPVDQGSRSPTRSYSYVKLNELHETRDLSENFNIYGVVEDCHVKIKQGHRTQTLDLILCDPSKSEFQVVVFSVNDENFPDVHPGDVVRVHRMSVESSRGKLKGKCYSPKFILVFSSKDKGEDPKSVANRFTFTSDDINRAAVLFSWDEKRKWRLISDAKVGESVNILCQVVSVYKHYASDSVLLAIWDGTTNDEALSEHQRNTSAVIDKELLNIAQHYLVHLWTNGNYAVPAAELRPGQFIEALDVQLIRPKIKNTAKANFCLRPPYKENRGVNVIPDDSDRLIELKSRLKKIIDDFSETASSRDSQDQNILNSDVSISPDRSQTQKRTPVKPKAVLPSEKSSRNIHSFFSTHLNSSQANVQVQDQNTVITRTSQMNAKGRTEVTFTQQPQTQRVLFEETSLVSQPKQQNQQATVTRNSRQTSAPFNPVGTQKPSQYVSQSVQASNASQVLSIVNAGILPGQSTQTFGSAITPYGLDSTQGSAFTRTRTQMPDTRTQNFQYSHLGSTSQFHRPSQLQSFERESQDGWWENIPTISESVGHSNIKPSTLHQVLVHSVPYKFRIFAVVLNYQPETQYIGDLIRLYCPKCHFLSRDASPDVRSQGYRNGVAVYYCPKCSTSSSIWGGRGSPTELIYTYLLSFSMHDGSESGAIDVYVWQDSAVKFFKGISPEAALTNSSEAESVFQTIWDVCPNSHPHRNTNIVDIMNGMFYPTLDCCIMSYTAGGVTRYQMFDTVLKS